MLRTLSEEDDKKEESAEVHYSQETICGNAQDGEGSLECTTKDAGMSRVNLGGTEDHEEGLEDEDGMDTLPQEDLEPTSFVHDSIIDFSQSKAT